MTTFSQIIDDAVAQTLRINQRTRAEGFGNQIIREMHTDDKSLPVYFDKNRVEAVITANVDSGFVWTPVSGLQLIESVAYPNVFTGSGKPVFAKFMRPGRNQNLHDFYYYRASSYFVFSGFGGNGAEINLSYLLYPPRLKYYATIDRPAEYDDVNGWTYFDTSAQAGGLDYTDPANQELARTLTTNWLLMDWQDTVIVGLKEAIYRDVGDDPRARTNFSKFSVLRKALILSEKSEYIFT